MPFEMRFTPSTRKSTVMTASLWSASHSLVASRVVRADVAADEVEVDRAGDGQARDDDEDQEGDDSVRRRERQPGNGRTSAGREKEVLRVHPRQQQNRA